MAFWKSFKSKFHKARQLSLSDAFLILEAWLSLAFFYLALHCMSLERMQGMLNHLPVKHTLVAGRVANTAAHINQMTGMAAYLHPWLRMTCLCRAMALQWMLSRRGILSVLRLGVLNNGCGVHGHAWLELDGAPLGEVPADLERFSLLLHRQNEP